MCKYQTTNKQLCTSYKLISSATFLTLRVTIIKCHFQCDVYSERDTELLQRYADDLNG